MGFRNVGSAHGSVLTFGKLFILPVWCYWVSSKYQCLLFQQAKVTAQAHDSTHSVISQTFQQKRTRKITNLHRKENKIYLLITFFGSINSRCKFCRSGTNRLHVVPPSKKIILNSLFLVLNNRIWQLIERKRKKKEKMLSLSIIFSLLSLFLEIHDLPELSLGAQHGAGWIFCSKYQTFALKIMEKSHCF